MKNLESNAKGIMFLAGTGLVLFIAYKIYQGASLVSKVAKEDLNPTSDKNVAYSIFNSEDERGNVTASLGTKIYDGVDAVMGWLPFLESDAEKASRLALESKSQTAAVKAAQNERASNYYDP